MYFILVFFFFFSSRRRHTRCLSDWSSDVCSSDLSRDLGALASCPSHATVATRSCPHSASRTNVVRSEERRVGKECRSRRSEYHYKKTNIQMRIIKTLM